MNNLYFNCESGICGDMILGAFVNLGVPADYLQKQLSKLNINEFKIEIKKRIIGEKIVTKVDVILNNVQESLVNPYSGNYRTYAEIRRIIEKSDLPKETKMLSKKIFNVKATAEAYVHNIPIELVKFHEAGAVDSIVDIIGAAICYNYMGIEKTVSSHIPTGFGQVKCACGILEVPAPAVKAIITSYGIPCYRSNVKHELATPTGMSIMASIVDEFAQDFCYEKVIKHGYGIGNTHTGLPPLEIILFES